MSNHYAIATVTATIQQLLDKAVGKDVVGATATMVSPDAPSNVLPDPGVNVFLYQVTPNAAVRNEDLPTRRADAALVQRPRVGVDLHYLLTVYGDAAQFEPQRVLGSVVRTLHEKPVLTRVQIDAARTAFPVLTPSNLSSEVELVKLTQLPLTLEELSKLWSVFFQTKYQLSVAYLGTVVLIEGEAPFASPLPVRLRKLYVETFREPVIEQVVAASGDDDPILDGSQIRIRGQRLGGDTVDVLVDGALATGVTAADGEVTATLPALPAGVHGVQVQHPRKMGIPPPGIDHPGVVSNVFPFVLTPTIRKNGAYDILLSNQTTKVVVPDTFDSADVTITIDPIVGESQRVAFLFNELVATKAHAYTFVGQARSVDTNTITIRAVDVVPGQYLVRVQVDGADSPLDVTGNAYSDPKVTL